MYEFQSQQYMLESQYICDTLTGINSQTWNLNEYFPPQYNTVEHRKQ